MRHREKGIRLVDGASDRRTTWLETFSDLVYAAAVANASVAAFNEYSWKGIGRFVLVFVPIWWSWIGSTFFASRFDTDDVFHRLLVMAQMAAVASLAVFTPSALGTGGPWYALAYALCRSVLVIQYIRAGHHIPRARRMCYGYAIGFSVAILVWLVSIFLPIEYRPIAWTVAIAIDLLTPQFLISEAIKFPPHLKHIPERFGLFTIIVLGEAVVATTGGMHAQELTIMSAFTAFFGIVLAFALWWDYFDGVGATEDRTTSEDDRGRLFRSWMYLHLPLTACITLLAVGIKHAIMASAATPFTDEKAQLLCVVTGCTMIVLGLIWRTTPRRTTTSRVTRQSAPYVMISSVPLAGTLGVRHITPPVLMAILAALFIGRIWQGRTDYRRCLGPKCDL